jgi:hypothetical protein
MARRYRRPVCDDGLVGVWVANVVFDVEGPDVAPVADLYAALLGMRRSNRGDHYRAAGWPADEGDDADPMVFAVDDGAPNITFELPQPVGYVRPAWPDPERPAHIHLDLVAEDLGAVDALVARHQGALLASADDVRTYADAGGHPFCVRPGSGGSEPGGALARIARIVVHGADPAGLARFWDGLLDQHGGPPLAFERTTGRAPAWPDPARPQQVHFDLGADDVERARARALELGARRLRRPDGTGVVLADPFGHPFCLGDEGRRR